MFGERLAKAHLRTRGLGQGVQQSLHDGVMPNERETRVVLHDGRDHPSVERVQQSGPAAAAVEESQPHPARKTRKKKENCAVAACSDAILKETVMNEKIRKKKDQGTLASPYLSLCV